MDQLLIQTLHNLRNDIQNVDSNLRSDMLAIESKLDSLQEQIIGLNLWKAKVLGGSVVLSAIGSGVITFTLHFLSK